MTRGYVSLTWPLFFLLYQGAMATILVLLIVTQPLPDQGLLTIRSEPAGIAVFLDGDSLGTTPIERLPVKVGTHSVTVVASDSLERLYWQVRTRGIGAKLAALGTLASIDAGTAAVELKPGSETVVTISSKTMRAAACRAKWLACAGVAGLFGLGVVTGVVIGSIAH